MKSSRFTAKTKEEAEQKIIDGLGYFTSDEFNDLLKLTGPSLRYKGVPLLNLVVRSSGPNELQAMLDAKANVNSRSDQSSGFGQSTALQWITGLLAPGFYFCGWPRSYKDTSGHLSRGEDELIVLHRGSANEIMYQIAGKLISQGAEIGFHDACALANGIFAPELFPLIESIISKYPTIINQPGPDGATPLAWAARRGQDKVVCLLLEKGADVNHQNEHTGLTPIEDAVMYHGTTNTMKILLKHDAIFREGIISKAIDNNRTYKKLDFILKKSPDLSLLLTVEDLSCIRGRCSYDKILEHFAVHKLSLAKVEKQYIRKEGHGLIFNGRNSTPKQLRLLISLGCDIQHDFQKEIEPANPTLESFPLVWERRLLSFPDIAESRWEKDTVLEKMAVLYCHGSPVEPKRAEQRHPIKTLNDEDFNIFSDYVRQERRICINQNLLSSFGMFTQKICGIVADFADDTEQLFKNEQRKCL